MLSDYDRWLSTNPNEEGSEDQEDPCDDGDESYDQEKDERD